MGDQLSANRSLRGFHPQSGGGSDKINTNRESLAVDFSDDSSFLRRRTFAVPVAASPISVAIPDQAKGFYLVAETNQVLYAVNEEPTAGAVADTDYVGWRISDDTYPTAGDKHILPKGTGRTLHCCQQSGGGVTNATVYWF